MISVLYEWREVVNERSAIESVRQLNENERNRSENVSNLQELLRKSSQLKPCRCVRLIDEQVESS